MNKVVGNYSWICQFVPIDLNYKYHHNLKKAKIFDLSFFVLYKLLVKKNMQVFKRMRETELTTKSVNFPPLNYYSLDVVCENPLQLFSKSDNKVPRQNEVMLFSENEAIAR